MNNEECDPAKVPLLFPDPVVEYYLSRIDRAAIREQLKRTVAERLEAAQRHTRAVGASVVAETSPGWPARKQKIEMGADPAWFAEVKAVPLLVADPVIEAYLEDVDRGLIRQALKLSPAERFERFDRLMRSAYELRRASASGTRAR